MLKFRSVSIHFAMPPPRVASPPSIFHMVDITGCVWPTDCLHNVRRAACGDVSRFSCYPPCRAYDSFVCLPLPARRCIDGIWTMCISLMCSNFAHPACILPACSAPPYIVAGGRKARPGTEVLKSRGGPARGSDEPSFQRVFVLNHPISDSCL